ncbi:hypothetical protein PGIGA_G00246370 [Pangasianodon gigas]|uniref:Uncharacterized protein n=1 Tax=Pangasianodon gigas TaxID=30993 RepID=A0ACC5WPP7_PANGG|nr:hypothetical protein [Pangasianodon gigas]
MSEGPSMISGPIPPDPTLFPECYIRPTSARGHLEGNSKVKCSALLNGPLAPDPTLYPECYSAHAPRPPCVGPNAIHILERNLKGEVGAILKLQGIFLNPTPIQQKPAFRDYNKENVRRLREIQKQFHEQEAQKERAKPVPVKALQTSHKYKHVPSRVMAHLQEKNQPKKPECQNFLKAHSLCGSGGQPQSRQSLSGMSPNSHIEDSDSEVQVRRHKVDFVLHNARSAGKTTVRSRSLQNQCDKPLSALKGCVPKYLEERKKQWHREAEERKQNIPDPSIPAGHTQMSDRERQETLQSLKETHRSLVSELLCLPVRADTLSVRSRREDLDRRLSEIEEAIKIFSRNKVYIRNDSRP